MFLTQKSRVPPPSGDFPDKDLYTKQWQQVQALANQFWTRWSREYLSFLLQRQKWTVPCRNLQVGNLVLLSDKQTTHNCGPTAMITATSPGKDGHIMMLDLRRGESAARRFIKRLSVQGLTWLLTSHSVCLQIVFSESKPQRPR